MATSDVFSQIRELQSAIDEFNMIGDTDNSGSSSNDIDNVLASGGSSSGKDDGTIATQGAAPAFDGLVDSVDSRCQVNVDEKTELPDEKTEVEPVDLSQLELSFSNDFSGLVDHFSRVRHATWITKEVIDEDDDEDSDNDEEEGVAYGEKEPGETVMEEQQQQQQQQAPQQDKEVARETAVSDKMLVEQEESHESFTVPTMPSSSTLRIRSRRPSSAVSKNSPPRKYTARSYSEMLRVPETRERLAFYERTFDACMKADSQLAAWISRMKAKGLPRPMTEGYQPPPRRAASPDHQQQQETPKLTSSISMFLRKASSSAALSRRTLTEMPRTSSSRFFLPPSMSRLSLSRSTRPKITPVKQDTESKSSLSKSVQQQRPPRPSLKKNSSWRDKSAESLRSTATRNTETTTDPGSIPSLQSIKLGAFVNEKRSDIALDEMCNVLPNLDRRVLEEYLAEAGGDAMTAITLAMTQHKKLTAMSSSSPAVSMRRLRCQKNPSRARSTRA